MYLKSLKEKNEKGCHSVFDRENIQDLYRLSPTQEGILFHYLNDPGSQAYFDQTCFHLTGKVSEIDLEKAYQMLVSKYDVLRTVFLHKK